MGIQRYFISNLGNDANDGNSGSTAWETISRLNSLQLNPGDEVLFRRGDSFSGELDIRSSGTAIHPIVIGSYGIGDRPVLTGAVEISDWKPESARWYTAKIDKPVYQLFSAGTQYNLARIPAKGFFSIGSGDKNTLTDDQHLRLNYDLSEATARIRAVNWQYETAQVVAHHNGKITFAESMMYQCNPRYGYLLDNKAEFLLEERQWFWDKNSHMLCLIPSDYLDPNDEKIEVTVYKNGITIGENVSHVLISGLQLEKYENAAILGLGNSSHITVSDCRINDVNVYGICLEINSHHYTISNNTIADIRGRGISTLESSFNNIFDNTISRVGLFPGYGFDGVNNGIGIAILKTEAKYLISRDIFTQLESMDLPADVLQKIAALVDLPYPDEKFVVEALEAIFSKESAEKYVPVVMPLVNAEAKAQKLESAGNRVAYNVVDSSGYAGIRLDGNDSIAEYNVIRNSLLHMNDGGALYCWAQNENYTFNNIFRSNIIINAAGSCEATANDLAYAYGIYTDNKCHHMTIENNTVVGTVGGILINDEAHHQKIIGNTLYDNQMGLVFSEYFMPDTLVGCEAHDNILFAKKRNQRALFVECRIREKFIPGLLDRNLYANPYYPFPIQELTYKDNVRIFKEYTLSSWQKHYGQDTDSKTIATANLFVVPTDLLYTDIEGNLLGKTVEVAPFSSVIILQN